MVRRTPVADVALRPIDDSDLDALFDQMRDPESVQMAAFTAKDPNDRKAFDTHMSRVRTSPDCTLLAVDRDGRFVGSIGSFVVEGDTEITYWIDRTVWGQGVASQALASRLPQQAFSQADTPSLRLATRSRLQPTPAHRAR
jgi:RimJ/RimL family protein N-acetyltransferase